MYKFKIPIGDWSKDGHGMCEYFIVESNKDLEHIVKTYVTMDSKFKISKECSDYEQDKLSLEFIDLLESVKLDVNQFNGSASEDGYYIYPDGLAKLIIELLMITDPELELKLLVDDVPMLNNWTAMKYHTSISLPGYGLFFI